MQKKSLNFAAIALALVLSGCGMFGRNVDETAGWSASRLYAEARDEMSTGNYERAISHFEKLEARYPFGTYAQQAQMEIAYAHYRSGDNALALAEVLARKKIQEADAVVEIDQPAQVVHVIDVGVVRMQLDKAVSYTHLRAHET